MQIYTYVYNMRRYMNIRRRKTARARPIHSLNYKESLAFESYGCWIQTDFYMCMHIRKRRLAYLPRHLNKIRYSIAHSPWGVYSTGIFVRVYTCIYIYYYISWRVRAGCNASQQFRTVAQWRRQAGAHQLSNGFFFFKMKNKYFFSFNLFSTQKKN